MLQSSKIIFIIQFLVIFRICAEDCIYNQGLKINKKLKMYEVNYLISIIQKTQIFIFRKNQEVISRNVLVFFFTMKL